MIRVLFICHGNICRSPMAEYVFKDMVEKENLSDAIYTASRATSTEEIGNGVYPPVRKLLNANGIDCSFHHATQITRKDYEEYDYLLIMDDENEWGIRRIIPNDTKSKIHKLLEFASDEFARKNKTLEIADPWYTRDFEKTWKQVNEGCRGLLNEIKLKYNL